MDEISLTMQEVYRAMIDFNFKVPEENRKTFRKAITTRTVLFIAFLTACMLVYYPLVIRSLNRSIKGNRALLVLVPEDVVPSVKALKDALAALVKKLT